MALNTLLDVMSHIMPIKLWILSTHDIIAVIFNVHSLHSCNLYIRVRTLKQPRHYKIHTHAYVDACTLTHPCTHTRTHARTHARTHTHTHTHTWKEGLSKAVSWTFSTTFTFERSTNPFKEPRFCKCKENKHVFSKQKQSNTPFGRHHHGNKFSFLFLFSLLEHTEGLGVH